LNKAARILLIDDESNVRKMTKARLEQAGYDVLSAARGELGLDVAQREKPDAIILDVMMPQMDGREVLKRLKADPETHDIPVIILTVIQPGDDMADPIPPGADAHLSKPYRPDELLQKLRGILDERKNA